MRRPAEFFHALRENLAPARAFGERHRAWLAPVFLLVWLASILLLLAAARPDWFGLQARAVLSDFRPLGASGWETRSDIARTLVKPNSGIFARPEPVVLENGTPLAYRVDEWSEERIKQFGLGRYHVDSARSVFSTSDNSSPRENGRSYELVLSRFLPGDFSVAFLLALALLSTRILLALAPRWLVDGLVSRRREWLTAFALAPLIAIPAAGELQVPASAFFEGGWSLFLWAWGFCCASALSAVWLRIAIRAGYGILLLAMAWQHFVRGGFGDAFYLLAGVLPQTDAFVHFMQARDLVLTGLTGEGFNGRLLYPALFSTWLGLTGLDLQLASMLDIALFVAALSIAARAVYERVALLGAFAFVAFILFYYQTHCCMLVMTENLGLVVGLLGLSFLLRAGGEFGARGFWWSLAAASLGTAVRPGAVFAAGGPAMAILHGAWLRTKGTAHRFRILVLTVLAICAVGVSGVVFNGAVNRLVLTAPVSTFGNFLYSVYGTVTNTQWTVARDAFGKDYAKGTQLILESVRTQPEKLVAGIQRAYSWMFLLRQAFKYKRYAPYSGPLIVLAALGLLACLLSPHFRRERVAVAFSVLGFLASIPFAPPWDTGMRAYAGFIPLLALLAAYGGWALARCAGASPAPSVEPVETAFGRNKTALGLLAFILLAILAPAIWPHSKSDLVASATTEPRFLRGSTITIGTPSPLYPARSVLSPPEFIRQSTLAREKRPSPSFLDCIGPDTLLGIDWAHRQLCVISLSKPDSHFRKMGGVKVQRSLVRKPRP